MCGGNHQKLRKVNRKPILPTNEEIAKKVSERVRAKLEQEKNHFGGQKARERISRVIPLVKELANGTEEDQMLLAYLVDRYAWKK